MRLPLLLSLVAVSSLSLGCGSGSKGSSSDDDDDTGTAFPNPGPVDVPTPTGGLQESLPDLMVDAQMLEDSWQIIEVNMDNPANQSNAGYGCAVQEGCIGASGVRRLLRFDVGVVNRGEIDLVLGDPNDNPQDYEYAPCHDHLHYKNFAKYELSSGGETFYGVKQAFCLIDLYDFADDGIQPSQGYDCGYQGISKGWGDIYNKELDCQWIDVTGVAPGTYDLSVNINAEHKIPEAGPFSNTATITVTID